MQHQQLLGGPVVCWLSAMSTVRQVRVTQLLIHAGKHQAVTVTTSDATPASASDPHATDRDTLLLLQAGHCAAVMPLCLFCRRACQLQRQYKGSRQVVRQLMIYMKGVLGLSSPGYTMRRSSSLHLLSGAG